MKSEILEVATDLTQVLILSGLSVVIILNTVLLPIRSIVKVIQYLNLN